jgi:hypothetical protein
MNIEMNIEVGKIYKVIHDRKGIFVLQVTSVNDEWISGIIIDGETNTVLRENKSYEGDGIQIRKSLASFSLILSPSEKEEEDRNI